MITSVIFVSVKRSPTLHYVNIAVVSPPSEQSTQWRLACEAIIVEVPVSHDTKTWWTSGLGVVTLMSAAPSKASA